MLVLMWAAELPLANNPFMDDHLIYAIVLVGLALAGAGTTLGLGNLPDHPAQPLPEVVPAVTRPLRQPEVGVGLCRPCLS